MGKGITFVGLDVHKEAVNVAMLLPGESRATEWQLSNTAVSIRRWARKLRRCGDGELRTSYEAGPCGYAVQRMLQNLGVGCIVVAPSLIPRKPGERVKTDRRDARKLAELLRAGLLTEVHPPTEVDEAVRDLCRAREDAHEDLLTTRRTSGCLKTTCLPWSNWRSAFEPSTPELSRSVSIPGMPGLWVP